MIPKPFSLVVVHQAKCTADFQPVVVLPIFEGGGKCSQALHQWKGGGGMEVGGAASSEKCLALPPAPPTPKWSICRFWEHGGVAQGGGEIQYQALEICRPGPRVVN